MHHTRRTHNAHNETQRRLTKLAQAGSVYPWRPHYTIIRYLWGDEIYDITPYWAKPTTNYVYIKNHGHKRFHWFESLEEANHSRNKQFYKKSSKSSGRQSCYGFYKKLLHRWWRRQPLEDTYWNKKGSHCSYWDLS